MKLHLKKKKKPNTNVSCHLYPRHLARSVAKNTLKADGYERINKKIYYNRDKEDYKSLMGLKWREYGVKRLLPKLKTRKGKGKKGTRIRKVTS